MRTADIIYKMVLDLNSGKMPTRGSKVVQKFGETETISAQRGAAGFPLARAMSNVPGGGGGRGGGDGGPAYIDPYPSIAI